MCRHKGSSLNLTERKVNQGTRSEAERPPQGLALAAKEGTLAVYPESPCGPSEVTCSSGSAAKKVLREPARGEALPCDLCVEGSGSPCEGSQTPRPSVAGHLHFWLETLRGEPKGHRSPRGPAGQGGSEPVGRVRGHLAVQAGAWAHPA